MSPAIRIEDILDEAVLTCKVRGADAALIKEAFLGSLYRCFPHAAISDNREHAFREVNGREGGAIAAEHARVLYRPRAPISAEELTSALHGDRIVGVQDGAGIWHFPSWQFTVEGPLSGLGDVLRTLRGAHSAYEPMAAISFFLNPDPVLGSTPLEALRAGKIEEVKASAKRAAE